MVNAGLVLEGGALRGVYTSAILDVFLDKKLYFKDVYSVSAGTTNALSYISKQKGRNIKINLNYVKDSRYLSLRNYIKDRSIFGFDFIFDEIANKLVPFDYTEFENSNQRLIAVATNCDTGKGIYFDKYNCNNVFLACRASCSMPYLAPIVHVNNTPCLDGGIADAIPIKKSIEEGNTKNVLILTRHKGYRKKTTDTHKRLAKSVYSHYPNLVKALIRKSQNYNRTADYIDKLEEEGKIFVIRPKNPITISRTEKDTKKLRALYMQGYAEALEQYSDLIDYLQKENLEYTRIF